MQESITQCPCGSGQPYTECCEVFHLGAAAPTAEKLMRSRFTAYALKNVDYLVRTTWPRQQPTLKKEEIHGRADNTRWTRLEIVDTQKGQTEDVTGVVEFKAMFTTPTELHEQTYHECSDFIQENGQWYFIYPNLLQTPVTSQQTGRNDPCPCGSGRKFKKCCMNK